MTKMLLTHLRPGMKLAKDVYLDDGRLLLLSGFIIKPTYIKKLKLFNVPFVYIREGEEIPASEICEEEVYREASRNIERVLRCVRGGKDIDTKTVKDTVNAIVQKVMENESAFMQLTGIRDIDSYTFLHSLDVCIYSVITGKALGMHHKDLTELGLGAILHDIGKCKVPLEILMKPAKLTDEEFKIMKQHTVYGYDIIKNSPGLNETVAAIACRHHEKWDGSGYPLGLKGSQIDIFSRIVTTADIYDALTSDRVYRRKNLPHEASNYIVCNSSILFDPDVSDAFIKNISVYPQGSVVVLNTGEVGKVLKEYRHMPERPKISVIACREGPPVLNPYIIDLLKAPNTFIVDILN